MSGPFMLTRTLAISRPHYWQGQDVFSGQCVTWSEGANCFRFHMTVPYRFKATSVGLHITMINDSHCQLAQILVSSGPDWGELCRFSGRTGGNWSARHRIAGAWFSVAVKLSKGQRFMTRVGTL